MAVCPNHRPPLDVDDAAAYLGVTPRWVRRAVAERRIPHFKVGRYVRFDPDDLDAYLEEQRGPSGCRMNGRSRPGGPPLKSWADTLKDTPPHPGEVILDVALEEAFRERDEGANAAYHASHPAWLVHVEKHFDALIASGEEFSADDLRERAGDPLASGENMIGGLFLRASKRGRISHVGYEMSRRKARRGGIVRTWRGVT